MPFQGDPGENIRQGLPILAKKGEEKRKSNTKKSVPVYARIPIWQTARFRGSVDAALSHHHKHLHLQVGPSLREWAPF